MSKISPKGQTIFKNLIRIAFLIALLLSSQLFAEKPVEIEPQNTLVQGNSIEAPKIPYIHSSMTLGVLNYDLYSEISKYDWDADLMYAVFMAESHLKVDAVNPNDKHRTCIGSYGIPQLSCEHLFTYDIWDSWQDPEVIIETAYKVYLKQGIRAWGSFTDKSYLRYL